MSRFNTLCVSLLFTALMACNTQVTKMDGPLSSDFTTPLIRTRAVQQTPVAIENLGEQVQRHLRARYADTSTNCGSDSQPAFLCSGILARGTATHPDFHVWNNSPTSLLKGGVSFSYLRKDANYRQLPLYYNNGYIFLPYRYAGEKVRPEILCSFAIDGYTDRRPESGCGATPGNASSNSCEAVGVFTAAQWWTSYGGTGLYQNQCGFNVRDARNELAGPAFDASIKSREYFSDAQSVVQNELIINAWGDGLGGTLPLEAFFYLYGTSGLQDAQRNQRDLKATDGVVIPIISVRLARTATDPATFYFVPEDQVEAMPPARP